MGNKVASRIVNLLSNSTKRPERKEMLPKNNFVLITGLKMISGILYIGGLTFPKLEKLLINSVIMPRLWKSSGMVFAPKNHS
jgi:hypothetical protein